MGKPEIALLREQDREKAISTLLLGFATDPFVRWAFSLADSYAKAGPAFDAFGGAGIEHGAAYVANDFEGVALWMPPGVESDEERFVAEAEKFVQPDRLDLYFQVLERMEAFHPQEDVWYLPLIGVDPVHQGRGIGTQLMKAALERIDQEGLPAYLESSNPRNVSLYERFGFVTMGRIQLGECPPVHPMIREASAST